MFLNERQHLRSKPIGRERLCGSRETAAERQCNEQKDPTHRPTPQEIYGNVIIDGQLPELLFAGLVFGDGLLEFLPSLASGDPSQALRYADMPFHDLGRGDG